ncbi:DUF4393 domain-containing protein [Agrobacterium rhizogenes]|nr:DUF4393 domain-containing protein [Rhizobium rhizogenes]
MPIDPATVVTAVSTVKKGLPQSFKEADKVATDLVKLVHLILAPVQFASAWQDRLSRYIDKAVRQVPQEQLVPPVESIALAIAEKLKLQGEDEPITELYINLLARAMDKERVGEAHPAFPSVIAQLAPDELIFLLDLAKRVRTVIMSPTGRRTYPTRADREKGLAYFEMPEDARKELISLTFDYEGLSQPEMYPVYQEHLQHLGLIEYSNELTDFHTYLQRKSLKDGQLGVFTLRLTHFGKLFLRACTDQGLAKRESVVGG